jgi:hypothetical protein
MRRKGGDLWFFRIAEIGWRGIRGRGVRPVTPLEIYLWDVLWFIQYLTVSFCMDRLRHKIESTSIHKPAL